MQKVKDARGIILALISSGTFGLIPLFSIPLLKAGDLQYTSILFYRFLFSAIMMGAICLFKRESFKISTKALSKITMLGVMYAATALLLLYSYQLLPSSIATTVHFLYPIAVTLIMVVLFKEQKSIGLFLAAVLSIVGVAILCWNGEGMVNLKGLSLVLITVLTYAIYIVGINKSGVGSISSEVLTFYVLLVGAGMFAVYTMATTGIEAIPPTRLAWQNLLLLAFLPTVVSDLTLILAIKYAGSTVTSILGSMEPLVAVMVGVLYFAESFTLFSFVGLALILVSVCVVILANKKKKTIEPDLTAETKA